MDLMNIERASLIDELVKKSQEGDQDAFSKLFDLLIDKVHRYIYFKVPEVEVDDLVELSFIKIWTNIKKFEKKAEASFESWVFKVIRNVVIDYHRFHRAIYPLESGVELRDDRLEANPRLFTEYKMNASMLKEALGELKETYAQIIMLKFINDFSNEEVAHILKKRPAAIRVLQFRALAKLKHLLLVKGIKY